MAKSEPKEKITDTNISHFNRYPKERAERDARRIYRQVFAGDMSTLSRDDSRAAGYPFGSVTPFIIDYTGCPVIYTADMAEHTKNILDNGKASLMMRQVERQHQIETGWRLTCAGDFKKLEGEEAERVAERYYSYYPEAKDYSQVHNFNFFRLNIVAARIIMGFGKISWIEPQALAISSPFTRDEENQIIEHMNADHQSAINHYLKNLGVTISDKRAIPSIVDVNRFGVVIDCTHRLYFVEFDEVVNNVEEARQQLVAMAKTG